MESTLLRFASAFVAIGCGAAIAQGAPDTTTIRRDTVAAAVVPAVVAAPAPVVIDTARKDSAVTLAKPDTTVATKIDTLAVPATPKPDTTRPPVAKPDTAAKVAPTKMAALDSSHCVRKSAWSLEGTIRYGWRLGELLEEEDRLTRQFKVVLVDKNDDTTNVNPVATGLSYQAALWFKGCCGNQFGIGLEYASLSEHPVSTYSTSLTEDFLEQFLVTARYRKAKPVTQKFHLLYEAAIGYSRTTIHGIPLVYANQSEPRILLTSSDRAAIALLHESTDANGIHGEIALGGQWRPSAPVGLAIKLGVNTDKIWRESSVSVGTGAANRSNASDLWSWGFDVGLSASHDF